MKKTVIETAYDANCRQCSRLADFLDQTKREYPTYFCKPVPPFGVEKPKLFVVGLAPGMHGANATGRPFTGDYAGVLLYQTLHKFGYATHAQSISVDDDLKLIDCRISNAVKCLPPGNKPTLAEIRTCNTYLRNELLGLPASTRILALGSIAHNAVLMSFGLKAGAAKFGHGAQHDLPSGHTLFDSYHCSRYNTNTRRLTEATFHAVFTQIEAHLSKRA
ncbi:MAG TPA: uracil-DNA glycosylase [Usitatibacteraceae bacterium]